MNVDWAWLRRVQGSKSKFNCVMLFALLLPSTALAGWQYHVGYWIWNPAGTYDNEYSSCADPADCVSIYETKQNIYYQNAIQVPGLPQLVLSCAVGDTAPPASWPNPTFSGRFTCETTWWFTVNGSWEATQTIETCPDHASGTPCVCDVGYKFDAAGTSCVPEQYTISLSGLGGEVMPTKTRAAYAQVVTNTGSPKSGAQVHLDLTVVPENGAPIRAEYVGSISPNGGSTGADGRLNFLFTAPVAGGIHTITATCTNCANQATGTIRVPGCSVPPLTKIEDILPNGPDVLPLTLELERTRGAGLALLPDAQAGVSCIKVKEPGTVITGGTRTLAYQAHLKEIWDKSAELDLPDNKNNAACQPLRDKVNAEKGCSGGHCITYPPAEDSNHPKGTAFDVSRETLKGLLGRLRPPPDLQLPPRPPLTPTQQRQADVQLIADWLASPAACNLVWGGSYGDLVHFSIP